MKKIAFLLTRAPLAPWTGRKQVLRTAIEAAQRLGWDVHLFVLSPSKSAREVIHGCEVSYLPRRSFFAVAPSLLWSLLTGRRSLNLRYFYSHKAARALVALAGNYDLAYVDGVRCAQYAEALGCPWHLDMDDLLSERYLRFSLQLNNSGGGDFGFAQAELPSFIRLLPGRLIAAVFRRESVLIAADEDRYAASATSVSLVSASEAETLKRRGRVDVSALPMAINEASFKKRSIVKPPLVNTCLRLGFVGPLYYLPNWQALRDFCRDLLPGIRAAGACQIDILHAGECSPSDKALFSRYGVEMHGYVESVADFMGACDAIIAPIKSGSGIKTKVLEAACSGRPLLASRLAVEGTGMKPGGEYFECHNVSDYAHAIYKILHEPEFSSELSARAEMHVRSTFGAEVVFGRWQTVLRRVVGA